LRKGLRTGLTCTPSESHVDQQTGKGTGTCAVCTFLTRPDKDLLLRVIYALSDQVLSNSLCGFRRTFHTTTDQGCGQDTLDGANVGGQNIKQSGADTQLSSQTTLFFRGTCGFGCLTRFTCTCGCADTGTNTNTRATAQGKERDGGAQSLTKFASYALFISGFRSQGRTCGLGQLAHLTPHRLFLGFGQQRRKARSSSLTEADCPGGQTLEELFDIAAKSSLKRRSGRRCYRTP
jgi:hypothetical protein